MVEREITSVGVHLTPDSEIVGHDFISQGVNVASIRVGDIVTIYANSSPYGDAAIIASMGALRDAADDLIASARERLRIAAGQQALPDGLEDATLADALSGMAPGEIVEVFGR